MSAQYPDNEVAPHAHEIVDPRFEAACDAIVSGDADTLRAIVAADPAQDGGEHGASSIHLRGDIGGSGDRQELLQFSRAQPL